MSQDAVRAKPTIVVAENMTDWTSKAADLFVSLAGQCIASTQRFSVALSGGSTPKRLYEALATDAYASKVAWDHVQLFWGDERAVPPTDPESNYKMVREALLDHVPIPEANCHRVPAELDPGAAATAYSDTLRREFHLTTDQTPQFDLVLLGLGDDGHTASLFPNTLALQDTQHLFVSNWVEKFNSYRLTMTYPVLNNASQIIFLAYGKDKVQTIASVLQGAYTPRLLPSQGIAPTDGSLTWLLDVDAAASLS